MKEFDKWWMDKENCGMNKNNKPPIQFTKLTPIDVAIHENVYIDLLIDDKRMGLSEKGIELMKAKRIFRKTFC